MTAIGLRSLGGCARRLLTLAVMSLALACADERNAAPGADRGGSGGSLAAGGGAGTPSAGAPPPVSGASGTPSAPIDTPVDEMMVDASAVDPARPDAGAPLAVPDAGQHDVDASAPAGDIQHCTFDEGCLEFRMHRPACLDGDDKNCRNVFDGTYGTGPCPPAAYASTREDQTGCGLTVSMFF